MDLSIFICCCIYALPICYLYKHRYTLMQASWIYTPTTYWHLLLPSSVDSFSTVNAKRCMYCYVRIYDNKLGRRPWQYSCSLRHVARVKPCKPTQPNCCDAGRRLWKLNQWPLKSPVVVVRLTAAITISEKTKLYTGHERTYIIINYYYIYIIFIERGELSG
jgi:hypothetical protein